MRPPQSHPGASAAAPCEQSGQYAHRATRAGASDEHRGHMHAGTARAPQGSSGAHPGLSRETPGRAPGRCPGRSPGRSTVPKKRHFGAAQPKTGLRPRERTGVALGRTEADPGRAPGKLPGRAQERTPGKSRGALLWPPGGGGKRPGRRPGRDPGRPSGRRRGALWARGAQQESRCKKTLDAELTFRASAGVIAAPVWAVPVAGRGDRGYSALTEPK